MKVGEISEAFTMIPQKTGKEECVIVKLKSRTNGHKATVADDYQNLKRLFWRNVGMRCWTSGFVKAETHLRSHQ